MGKCSCIYVGDDESLWARLCLYSLMPGEVYLPRNPVARKEHECQECNRIIRPGEEYEYVFAIYGDSNIPYSIMKTCSDCLVARAAFFCGGFYHGSIWEDIWEHLKEINGRIEEDCIASLTPLGQEKVCQMIEEIWERQDEE